MPVKYFVNPDVVLFLDTHAQYLVVMLCHHATILDEIKNVFV